MDSLEKRDAGYSDGIKAERERAGMGIRCVVCKGRTARVRVSYADWTHSDICGRRDMDMGVFEPSSCLSSLSLNPAKIEQL